MPVSQIIFGFFVVLGIGAALLAVGLPIWLITALLIKQKNIGKFPLTKVIIGILLIFGMTLLVKLMLPIFLGGMEEKFGVETLNVTLPSNR